MAVEGAREAILSQDRGPLAKQVQERPIFLQGHERPVLGARNGHLKLEVRRHRLASDQGHPVEDGVHAGPGHVPFAYGVGELNRIARVLQEIVDPASSVRS